MLKGGGAKCVVCTSSLDLGVDFSPVEQVIQVGSPKGVARLMQRAGRSGHAPGQVSRVLCVPTHAFETMEFAAARDAANARRIEGREPLEKPLDVLVQHLVTMAAGGGFEEREMLAEVRGSWAFRGLTDEEWGWSMDFVRRGGPALRAYPRYARISPDAAPNRWTVASDKLAAMHRMSIGTITNDPSMFVKYLSGKTLGTIEESFIGKLREGDRFVFAGRTLELARVRDMTAYVRRTKKKGGIVPTWNGGKMPLSSQLSEAVREKVEESRQGRYESPEMVWIRPLMELQRRWSKIPEPGQLLVERVKTRDGHHLFLFPFEGRLVHEGLAALCAYRVSRLCPASVHATATDYGFDLHSPEALPIDAAGIAAILSPGNLLEDLLACLNATQMARRRFRDIARVAGLILQGYPGAKKPARQLQASSELFFDVFEEFDPGNMLLTQARREVLEDQLEIKRMRQTLERVSALEIVMVEPQRLTPLAFPVWAEVLRSNRVSSESWSQQISRMSLRLEEEADKQAVVTIRSKKERSAQRSRG
jgi:ATP-dependent Lhr-like helicase